ncbi:hypothetical protein PILCRDRAFT_91773 [Piloderma croceum F 1598]|uniref:Uncharacterized protein n=1 Tax=Piloderma croceum (strain F 1598) TaxID=765440 RepID=A0A0C3F8J2_PILCF|nr:hypothetical protein PILCRDRAFT_91773 [Piloderma croceum F 1598]
MVLSSHSSMCCLPRVAALQQIVRDFTLYIAQAPVHAQSICHDYTLGTTWSHTRHYGSAVRAFAPETAVKLYVWPLDHSDLLDLQVSQDANGQSTVANLALEHLDMMPVQLQDADRQSQVSFTQHIYTGELLGCHLTGYDVESLTTFRDGLCTIIFPTFPPLVNLPLIPSPQTLGRLVKDIVMLPQMMCLALKIKPGLNNTWNDTSVDGDTQCMKIGAWITLTRSPETLWIKMQ